MPWVARNTGLEIINKWWLTPTIANSDVVVAYQPIGADSLAQSYTNLADPGTNDASVIVAPTWTVTDGWIFDNTQSLDTGITGNGEHSGIARCGTNTTSADGVFGYEDTKDWNVRLDGATPSSANVSLNYDNTLATQLFSGINILDVVLCAARNQGYVNGSRFIAMPGTLQTWSNATVTIAGAYASAQLDGTMKAFALYTRQLTEAEAVDLTAQMAALTSVRPNPQRVNYIAHRPSTKRLNSTSHELLIATDAGIYHTINGGISWTKITTLNEPSNAEFADSPAATLDELTFHSIEYGNTSENTVIALAQKVSADRQWIYKSTDGMATWANRGIITA